MFSADTGKDGRVGVEEVEDIADCATGGIMTGEEK